MSEPERKRLKTGDRQPTLEELHRDALNAVLSFLHLDELDVLSLVSRRIHGAVGQASHLITPYRFPLFSRAGFARLLDRFRSLNVLSLSNGLSCLGGDLFTMLNQSTAASTLTKITLDGCYLSERDLKSIPVLLDMPNLVHIELQGDFEGGFGSITSSTSLRYLRMSCRTLRDEDVSNLIQPHRQLESLVVEDSLHLSKPVVQFDQLQTLSMKRCPRLVELPRLSCPNLHSLDLDTVCLGGNDIQDIINSLPKLERLVLTSCLSMVTLNIQSASLKSIHVTSCRLLEVLEVVSPHLSSLEVRRSTSVEKVRIVSGHTSKVIIPFAPSLVELDVAVCSLGFLDLMGCDALLSPKCHIQCESIGTAYIMGTSLAPEVFAKARHLQHEYSPV